MRLAGCSKRCIPRDARHAVEISVVAGELRQAFALHGRDN